MLTNSAISKEVVNYLEENRRLNRIMIAIGREISWEIESSPPLPSPKKIALDDPLSYKLADKVIPIYPNDEGSITISGVNYSELENTSIEEVREKEAFSLLVEATFSHDDLSFQNFRESGIVIADRITPGVILSNNKIYTNKQILNYHLEVYQTFSPVNIETDTVSKIAMIRPFI